MAGLMSPLRVFVACCFTIVLTETWSPVTTISAVGGDKRFTASWQKRYSTDSIAVYRVLYRDAISTLQTHEVLFFFLLVIVPPPFQENEALYESIPQTFHFEINFTVNELIVVGSRQFRPRISTDNSYCDGTTE